MKRKRKRQPSQTRPVVWVVFYDNKGAKRLSVPDHLTLGELAKQGLRSFGIVDPTTPQPDNELRTKQL